MSSYNEAIVGLVLLGAAHNHDAFLCPRGRKEGVYVGETVSLRACLRSDILLDFPAQLEDGSSIADKENFVLDPFLALCKRLEPNTGQVIAMGSAFKNLPVANRIELTTKYGNEP